MRRVHGDGGGEGARDEERGGESERVGKESVPEGEGGGEAAGRKAVEVGDMCGDRVVAERLLCRRFCGAKERLVGKGGG